MFRKMFGNNKKRERQREAAEAEAAAAAAAMHPQQTLQQSPTTQNHHQHQHSPMFTYAMKEYAQTVPATSSNDDGHIRPTFSMQQQQQQQQENGNGTGGGGGGGNLQPILEDSVLASQGGSRPPGALSPPGGTAPQPGGALSPPTVQQQQQQQQQSGASQDHEYDLESVAGGGISTTRTRSMMSHNSSTIMSPKVDYSSYLNTASSAADNYNGSYDIPPSPSSTSTTRHRSAATAGANQEQPGQQQKQQPGEQKQSSVRFPLHPNSYVAMMDGQQPPMTSFADTTYEESYGDAYVGGTIRYLYPSGYQSMRPRSGPWKLSIVVCLCFTWLSVFVIGHCSDQYNNSNGGNMYVGGDQVYQYQNYNNNNNNNNNGNGNDDQQQQQQMDDDQYNIETKWCGSRLLYWMWVMSMLITGVATAYCSVIGYIKVRDFAVANVRSQPPGVVSGGAKSDYYVQIAGDHQGPSGAGPQPPPPPGTGQQQQQQQQNQEQYNNAVYQSDGNVRFLGDQIYRPTQAAVATTSR